MQLIDLIYTGKQQQADAFKKAGEAPVMLQLLQPPQFNHLRALEGRAAPLTSLSHAQSAPSHTTAQPRVVHAAKTVLWGALEP